MAEGLLPTSMRAWSSRILAWNKLFFDMAAVYEELSRAHACTHTHTARGVSEARHAQRCVQVAHWSAGAAAPRRQPPARGPSPEGDEIAAEGAILILELNDAVKKLLGECSPPARVAARLPRM